jgi:tRNA threonylcarbamoyladenosine biosynthesis protein TsaB
MALILNIDTALDTASICLVEDGVTTGFLDNSSQKDHAAWLHSAIADIFRSAKKKVRDLSAVAVNVGPGSYTGLRIGLASAKGLCYALNCPLIGVHSTEVLACAVKDKAEDLIIPLIDARRREVFTAVYDSVMRVKNSTYALILQPGCFDHFLDEHKIIFCGNAVEKSKQFISHRNAHFSSILGDARQLSAISELRFSQNAFTDLSYSEPFYLKDFQSSPGK